MKEVLFGVWFYLAQKSGPVYARLEGLRKQDRRRRAGAVAEPWKAGDAKRLTVELAKGQDGRTGRTFVLKITLKKKSLKCPS